MSVNFDASSYEKSLVSVKTKQEELMQVQHQLDKINEEVASVREQRRAQHQKLADLRKGIDLRVEAKKNRATRTLQLREAGILLLNEYIEKVREPRKKS